MIIVKSVLKNCSKLILCCSCTVDSFCCMSFRSVFSALSLACFVPNMSLPAAPKISWTCSGKYTKRGELPLEPGQKFLARAPGTPDAQNPPKDVQWTLTPGSESVVVRAKNATKKDLSLPQAFFEAVEKLSQHEEVGDTLQEVRKIAEKKLKEKRIQNAQRADKKGSRAIKPLLLGQGRREGSQAPSSLQSQEDWWTLASDFLRNQGVSKY